jgi:hypothetical protein
MRYAWLTPAGKPAVGRKGKPYKKTRDEDRVIPLDPRRSTRDKQIRARARRRGVLLKADLDLLYKPIEEWDDEELARGRPRDSTGGWRGKTPPWISKAYHEEIIRRFEKVIKSEMNAHTIEALSAIQNILENNKMDRRGRPMVPHAVKLDAAKFLVEHVLGKPKQRVESEVSVTLQGILGHAMVNPNLENFDEYQLTQGYIDAEVVDDSMGRRNDGR